MADESTKTFGLIVAYLVPGFIGLSGLTPIFPNINAWLQPVQMGELGWGPPIYAVLAALGVGLTVSCFRWLLIDQFHYWTGVRRPAWDDSRLQDRIDSFDYLVQNHFRYYEFTGNTLIAGLFAYGLHRTLGTLTMLGPATDLVVFTIGLALFTAGRDALVKYYLRTARLVGAPAEKGGRAMFNGNHHGEGDADAPAPAKTPTPNQAEKPQAAIKPAPTDIPSDNPKPKK